MTKVNTPILSGCLKDDLISTVIYSDDPEKANMIVGFLSEFLTLVKSLPIDKKPEIATGLRNVGVPQKSLETLVKLFDQSDIPFSLKKKLVLGHLELVYHGIRNDQGYAREIFMKIPITDLLDRILGFEDLSTSYFPR
jgi:hypothetical protein